MEDLRSLMENLDAEWRSYKSEKDADGKKLAQLERQVRDLETRANGLGATAPAVAADEDAQEFGRYVRSGGRGEAPRYKAMDATTAANGAIIVPGSIAAAIAQVAGTYNPIGSIVSRVAAGTASFSIPVITTVAGTQWSSDTGTRSETSTPSFTNIQPPSGELSAVAQVSNFLLDDAAFDVQSWLAQELGRAFGLAEAAAFVNGTGTAQPKGITTYTINASPSFGQVGYVASASASAITADSLISLVYSLGAEYRAPGRAAFVMAPTALSALRSLKDSNGHYLFEPGLAGEPASLLGYPIHECADLPTVAANAYPIWFGDWKRFYTAIDVGTPRLVLDPYTVKGRTVLYMARRVGGCVVDSTAVKALKVAAS